MDKKEEERELKRVKKELTKEREDYFKELSRQYKVPKLDLRQKAADIVTHLFGSWEFILSLFLIMIIWITMNVLMIVNRWDPYPFILLNFVLSTLAAIQAPIILMSQNRQAQRDRGQADRDYLINIKAEKEIESVQEDLKEIKRLLKKKK